MTAVIWMLAWLPQVLAAMSKLPPPYDVKVNSSHFIHLLTWEPGPGTPREAHYRVTVFSANSGSSWEPVAGCEHVQHPLVCDVTEAFPDHRHSYYINVTAALGDQESKPASYEDFVPIRDTHLDPPLLNVTPCNESLCVGLSPPVERLREIYNSFQYTLKIESSSTDTAQILKETRSLKGEILKNVAPGRQYCVSVKLSDSLRGKSNYSQPQCTFTNGVRTADPEISAGLCLLVVLALVILALLVRTRFICLRAPLPLVLTSIQHMEEVLVAVPCYTPPDPVHIEPTPSSTGAEGNSTSDDSDGETERESTGRSGGGYNLRAAANLLSASSSSSSCLPSPLSPEPARPPNPGPKLPSDLFTLDSDHSHLSLLPVSEEQQLEALISANIQFIAGSDRALTTHTTSQPTDALPKRDQRDFGLRSHTDTFEGIKPKDEEPEEKEEVGERSGQGVNLFSITLGGRGEEEEEEKADVEIPQGETMCPFDREESLYNATPLLPSQTAVTEEVAMKTVSTFDEEEEEEEEEEEDESSGYLRRPCI